MDTRPRYIEAYPRVAARDAIRAIASDRTHVSWYDELSEIIGHAHVRLEGADKLLVVAAVLSSEYIAGCDGGRTFCVTYKGSDKDNEQPFFVCGLCAKTVAHMTLATGEWACSYCHGLKSRSSFLSTKVRYTAELEELERNVGRGRPLRMREHRYKAMLERMQDLREQLGGQRLSLGRQYSHIVTAQWSSAEPA